SSTCSMGSTTSTRIRRKAKSSSPRSARSTSSANNLVSGHWHPRASGDLASLHLVLFRFADQRGGSAAIGFARAPERYFADEMDGVGHLEALDARRGPGA